MKKIIVIALLVIGTSSFAANPKKVEKVKKEKAVACCSVGEFTECGFPDEPLCDRARAKYCAKHECSKKTISSIQP